MLTQMEVLLYQEIQTSIICHQMEGENVLYMRVGNKENYSS